MTEANLSYAVDAILLSALVEIQKTGAGYDLVIDRLLNVTATQIAGVDGVAAVARVFRGLAQSVDDGALDAFQAPGRVQ